MRKYYRSVSGSPIGAITKILIIRDLEKIRSIQASEVLTFDRVYNESRASIDLGTCLTLYFISVIH
jgi:hypothetical protein